MITEKLFKESSKYAEDEVYMSCNSILSKGLYYSEIPLLHHEFFSLKKGRIFSITHQLPENCPFASYDELRKHWKLMVSRLGICKPFWDKKINVQRKFFLLFKET